MKIRRIQYSLQTLALALTFLLAPGCASVGGGLASLLIPGEAKMPSTVPFPGNGEQSSFGQPGQSPVAGQAGQAGLATTPQAAYQQPGMQQPGTGGVQQAGFDLANSQPANSTTGSQAFSQNQFQGAGNSQMGPPSAESQPPMVTLVMRPKFEDSSGGRIPLDGPVFVNDLIDQAEVKKRFRRFSIDIYRSHPGGRHKLEVRYDRKRKTVLPEFDYQLRDGDQIVITQDTSTILDDMIKSVSGRE